MNLSHPAPSPLTRAQGGFARVYLALESDGAAKAVKVIAKEQLKSTKTKTKVRFFHRTLAARTVSHNSSLTLFIGPALWRDQDPPSDAPSEHYLL